MRQPFCIIGLSISYVFHVINKFITLIYSDIFKILTTAFSTLRTVSVWEAP